METSALSNADSPGGVDVIGGDPEFSLAGDLDLGAYAAKFAARGRVHIPNILNEDGARALHRHLSKDIKWSQFLYSQKHLWEVRPESREKYTPEQEDALREMVYSESREKGYAFHYSMNRITTDDNDGSVIRAPHTPLMQSFLAFMNSPQFLDFIRRLTGMEDVVRAEANCTLFSPGQFLAGHDDSSVDSRRLAYVVNLTETWRAEWGGLLEFWGEDGHIEEAWVPVFNSFNIFKVPMAHAVSCVAPFAGDQRLAISGWLHSE